MGLNTNITQLDVAQTMKRTFDVSNDANRVSIVSGIETSIEVSHEDGDSIHAYKGDFGSEVAFNNVSAVTLTEVACPGVSRINLHAKVISSVDSNVTLAVHYSPLESGDFWLVSGVNLSVLATDVANTLHSGTEASLLAKRVKIVASHVLTSGEVQVALIGD